MLSWVVVETKSFFPQNLKEFQTLRENSLLSSMITDQLNFYNVDKQYNNIVDVQGRKYVLGPTQAHFSPSVARAKMNAEKGPKHIYALEHQLYYYYYNFEEHLVQKKEHFATSETRMTRWLWPAGSNMLEPAKMFIRARIIRHNARQSYNNSSFCYF